MKNKGLSLTEILVSIVILSLTMVGMINVFIAGKRYIRHSSARTQAAELAKYVLEPLYNDTRQESWGDGTYNNLFKPPVVEAFSINNLNYNATSTTSAVGSVNLQKVKVAITWNETS